MARRRRLTSRMAWSDSSSVTRYQAPRRSWQSMSTWRRPQWFPVMVRAHILGWVGQGTQANRARPTGNVTQDTHRGVTGLHPGLKAPFQGFPELAHGATDARSEEHTSELQSQSNLVCRLLLEKKKKK